jgi:hypothetical protein
MMINSKDNLAQLQAILTKATQAKQTAQQRMPNNVPDIEGLIKKNELAEALFDRLAAALREKMDRATLQQQKEIAENELFIQSLHDHDNDLAALIQAEEHLKTIEEGTSATATSSSSYFALAALTTFMMN